MALTLAEIEEQLKEPFSLEDIDFLPKGNFEKNNQTFCMGMPFADVRVYQDRLNKLACGEWSTPSPIVIAAGNKIITYVTVVICGVPHSDVGEAFLVDLAGKREENTATEAFAQAFKRACSQFGLGRYLYSLDKAYLPYDKQKKRIDLDANEIRKEVYKLYVKAGLLKNTPKPPTQETTSGTSPSVASPNGQKVTQAKAVVNKLAIDVLKRTADRFVEGGWKSIRGYLITKYQLGDIPDEAFTTEHRQNAYDLIDSKARASRPAVAGTKQ